MSASNGPLADRMSEAMFKAMNSAAEQVAEFGNKDKLSESDMIKFNMAASRYTMITNLTANLAKNLTECEKQIAQRM